MSHSVANEPLALAAALTRRTEQLCIGLEHGIADILELVTPVTGELLRWWFGEDACGSRKFNFHPGQRRAILNTIVAHEVLNSPNLVDLYRQVCAEALLEGDLLGKIAQDKPTHPKYCLKMATGTGKTWVLQALLIWQLLNKTAALEEGRDDPRFTRRFLIVAPGLIVYERLLDAFLGKEQEDKSRDFASSDIAVYADLFVPPARRERIQQFVRGNVCRKDEIGLKATGNGMIAITNWQWLREAENEEEELDVAEATVAPAMVAEPSLVACQVLPLTPGRATGNSLDVLDRRWARGNVLSYLADLSDLMVFNDEAHHIHELKKEGEVTEVEWQKSLSRIADGKGRRFVQVDFSATPYNDVGGGKKKRKLYFPHIVVDFDLKDAMRLGLVKSLVLDKRKEIGALPLEFKAERDADGNAVLSEGQEVMLRAGLQKLRKLEADFARLDSERRPKMLVVCEDTSVSPRVAAFLRDQGLQDDDVLTVDSGRKAELGEKEWVPLRQKLFNVDRHAQPRVIVSVLMLREGFDVNNICVIVPLRSSQAQILLEQTIGRGLRLMWRDPEYADIKQENRERINRGEEPGSLIDILSIVEHPAYQSFYDDLIKEGLVGKTGDDDGSGIGDLIASELRTGFERYDFAIPFILRDADEDLDHLPIDIAALDRFRAMSRAQLSELLGKGDTFISQDLQSSTLFGDYRVDGAVMDVSGYNEFLSRLTRRIGQALSQPLSTKGNRVAEHLAMPYMQVNTTALATALDDYIRDHLFGEPFEPFEEERWRLLLLRPVIEHVIKVFALALVRAEDRAVVGETEVRHRRLSEVSKLMVRESASLVVGKCIYERLPYPTRSGGLERAFIEWAGTDSTIEAFCRISENRHDFVRLRYVREDGLPAFYFPDFLVRTADAIYLAETKSQQQTTHPNVQRKLRAAAAWCERINDLPPDQRGDRIWHYAMVGESVFHDWRKNGGRLGDLLAFSRVRAAVRKQAQGDLGLG
ncbi:MAG TPA: DEAD/DEAH box helicase family protein [Xanthomonadaceae bacterium]|jgi:type III restriction enzyme|nr:DEAD/DEAH box helicase family protein [Xanthomonadaceae bacterium]